MKRIVITAMLSVLFAVACGEAENTRDDTQNTDNFRKFYASEHICTYCGEAGDNNRFGGLIVTSAGDELPFGSLECVAGHLIKNPELQDDAKIWVVDYNGGERIVPVEDARFIRTDLLNSPNGLNLISYTGKEQLDDNFLVAYGGEVISWEEVKRYVNENWMLQ